jgi:subtilisin family serine protease
MKYLHGEIIIDIKQNTIMRKTLLTLFAALLTAGYVSAQSGKLSPYTRIYLEQHKTEVQQQRAKAASGKSAGSVRDSIDTFLKLNDGQDVSEIEGVGVRVVNRFGQLLTVRIALGDVEKVATLPSVKDIDMGAPVHLCNDSARIASKVDILHSGGGALGQQYKGKGVIVGVIDLGIEYNHINFKNANGKSRVKMVYDAANDKTYLDPDDIAALTTDDSTQTHGTHTTGTAAGSYTKNGYQGMAPEADLVLCGAGRNGYFYDADMLNSIFKIFRYADLVGKPAVVNMSIGSNYGPHDGTDYFNYVLTWLKSNGYRHILCLAASNEGTKQMYIRHQSANSDYTSQFKTLLTVLTSDDRTPASIDTWSKSSEAYYIRMAVVDKNTGAVLADKLYAPSEMTETTKDTTYTDSTSFAKYFKGKIIISGSLNNNNRYNNLVSIDEKSTVKDPPYRLSMDVYAKQGSTIEAWECTGTTNMKSYNLPGYISGTDSCSINSMCYNDNNICVGSYVTRHFLNTILSKPFLYTKRGEKGDIASSSSYGIKDDGTVLPDIVAPGSMIISSYNYAARQTPDSTGIIDSLNANGRTYYWGYMQGTSMACPVVTGIIADWLQCKPTLTVDEIKTILDATAVDDYYVKKHNHVKSGRGKIDAYAGLRYLLTTNIGNPECVQHQVLIYPSADGKVNIYAQGETGNIHVGMYAASGMTVLNRTIATTDGSATLDLGNMPKGLYIIKVEGVKARGSNTLTVR